MKKINTFIILLSIMIGVVYGINFIKDGEFTSALSAFVIFPIIIAPRVISKIIKKENIWIDTIYIVFIFLAQVLGSVVGLYHSFNGYDKIVHTISGIVTSFLGIYIIFKFKKSDNNIFNFVFVISISLSVALLWEVIEFSIDNIFNTDVQWVIKTGVNDTMTDMICALLGTLMFNLCYIFEQVNNKKLIITKFINSLK